MIFLSQQISCTHVSKPGRNGVGAVSGIKRVTVAFLPLWKSAQSAFFSQGGEFFLPAGQYFMCIGLMTHIPDQLIFRKIQHIVERQCKLYHPQVGCKMPPCLTHRFNQKSPDFICKLRKIRKRNFMDVIWLFYFFQNHLYPSFTSCVPQAHEPGCSGIHFSGPDSPEGAQPLRKAF